MNTDHLKTPSQAARIETYFDRLWPICRSITGPGLRRSQDILAELLPLQRLSFPTGYQAFDWTVPREWDARDAYLEHECGQRYAEFKRNNLHLIGYSVPVSAEMDLEELQPRLHSLPDQPDAIPYLTSYYKENWGFCLSQRERDALPPGRYRVVIDTELREGHVDICEAVLPGETEQEILFSSYLCHPSLASNELSGPLTVAFLYEKLAAMPSRRFTYRFLVSTETIGTICYLSQRHEQLSRDLVAGFVLTSIGDRGNFTHKGSRQVTSLADRATLAALRGLGLPHRSEAFDPADGSDDRHYCAPGLNLPVCTLMRTPYGQYPEYHTSLDNKELVSFEKLAENVEVLSEITSTIENNGRFRNLKPICEPQLGKRGLYPSLGSQKEMASQVQGALWLLNYSDGDHDLIEISKMSGVPVSVLNDVAAKLVDKELLEPANG